MTTPLDNPFWSALASIHDGIALRAGEVARYPADHAPFLGVANADVRVVRAAAADKPDDVDAQLAVADIDMIGGQIQDAFDRLLDFVAAGHKADIEPVRQRLLEYFTIPEPTDERLKRARRRLATLMY